MTVTYTAKVATSSMGCFLKLLLRWRGSVYKLVWREFLIFLLLYYTISLVYRFALDMHQQLAFSRVTYYCRLYIDLIPLAFVLGFYVSVVLARWWEQFNKIPWPDRMALFVTASVQGDDERGRLMRRSIMRYLCLSFIITLSSISPPVKKRFPSFQHMTEAGFMQESEQKIMESMQTPHNKYFIPLVWSTSLVGRARKEGRIKDDYAVKTLIDEINAFRGQLGSLFNYDWISIPLVYTQVVTLATYTFFLASIMGRQQLEAGPDNKTGDVYVPVFAFLQFLFYMGWLKVAETLVNPFGEDDDDFDINQVIDRNLQVSYLVVDEMHQEHPELIKDAYWDDIDFELPYTGATAQVRPNSPFLGSAMDINVSPKQNFFVAPSLSSIEEQNQDSSKTGPTNIPIITASNNKHFYTHQPRHHLPQSSSKPKLFSKFLRRSTSKRSEQTVDSDSATGSTTRLKRQESNLSKGSEDRAASPTLTSTQGDIFSMEDLSDEEAEITYIPDSASSQTTSLLDAFRSKLTLGTTPPPPPTSTSTTLQAEKSKPSNREKSKESLLENTTTSVDENLTRQSNGSKRKGLKKLFLQDTKSAKDQSSSKATVSLPATPLVTAGVPGGNTISLTNMTIEKEDKTPEYLRTHSLGDTQPNKTITEQV